MDADYTSRAYARLRAAQQAMASDLKRTPAVMARGLDPAYRMRPHLAMIGEHMAEVLAGHYDRLLILTPTQVGKSTLVAEWGPFWWLANRPSDDIIIASYGADLAVDRSKGVRHRLQLYGDEYDLALLPGSEAAHDWETTSGGHLRAVGVAGALSGFPANLIIVDDPHKDRIEADSPRIRKAVHEWWSSTAAMRLQPDMGAVIAIMTRWHVDDFAGRRLSEEGRLEEGGRWMVLHLPAIADPKFGKDPLGREPGQPLTHPKIPSRDVARLTGWWNSIKRGSLARDWHALAQGDPQPVTGTLVSSDLLRNLRDAITPVTPTRKAVAVDPSGGGRDTAGIVAGFLGDDLRLWITHDWSGVMASDRWATQACLLAVETDATLIVVEVNFGGDMCSLAIRTAWRKLQAEGKIPADHLPPLIRTVRARVGKVLRAEPVAQQMLLDRVRLRGMFLDLEYEWSSWLPTDKASPGRIDASVYLAMALLPPPPAGSQQGVPSGQLPATEASPLAGHSLGAGVSGFGPLA